MTELSEEARRILDEGAEAALAEGSSGDANWAALTARVAAAPPPGPLPSPNRVTLGAVGKLVLLSALVLGGVAGGVALGGVAGGGEAASEPSSRTDAETIEPAPASVGVEAERRELGDGAEGRERAEAPATGPNDADPDDAAAREAAASSDLEARASDGASTEPTGEGEAPAKRPTSARSSRSSSKRAGTIDDVDELAEEERLVSAARRELQRDPAAALRRLDTYDARYPHGVLAQEAAATRILALCQLGRRDQGDRLAADFARRWPDAPALARVRGACREPEAP
ncbi:MAG: hypothetical protein R3B09_00100 [Nannocystaceae bacterium]